MKHLRTYAAALAGGALLAGCATSSSSGPAVSGPVEVRRTDGGPAAAPTISATAKRKFDEAVAAWEAQKKAGNVDYELLTGKFSAAVEADENLAEGHYNLGVLAERRGKPDEAVAHYKRALERKPSLTVAYENLAVMMENAGRRDEAAEQYKKILEQYPDDAGSRARLAELLRETGDEERALELSKEALLRDPKNLTAYKVQMKVYLGRGDLSMGRLVALRALALDDKDPELHFTIGQILEKEGELAPAIAKYKKALALRDDYLPARQRIVEYALSNKNFAAAEQQFRALLAKSPNDAVLHYDLGVALRGQGKLDEAMQSYEKALALDPEQAAPLFATGVVLHKYKDAPEKALEYYEKFTRHPTSSLPSDHPVFAYIQECRALIDAKKEAAEMEKKMLEEQKAAEEKARQEAEAQKKADAQKALEDAAKTGGADPNASTAGDAASKAAAEPKKPEEAAPAPAPAPPPPAPPAPKKDKDPDEPTDDLL